MNTSFRTFVALALCISSATAMADDAADPNARDLLILADWFEGEFDNEEQLWFHERSRATTTPPTRVHMTNARVDLDAFGEHVFYVEEYLDHDPQQIYRQRLVVLGSDIERNAIRMQQGFFKAPQSLRGAHMDSEKLADITPDDVTFIDSCDVYLRRVADQFQGGMDSKACVFGDGADRRYSVHDMTISAAKFWRADATYRVSDDSFFKGTEPGTFTELRRARIYYCDLYFYAEDGSSQVAEDLRVHGQGGTASVRRESDDAMIEILLRAKEYPYYTSRPDFIYYSIRHKGERRSIFYGVADPDSRQFGAKAGDIGAFCHQDGYTFRQSFGEF